MTSQCALCGTPGAPSRCGKCHRVYYCNSTCQSQHWKRQHKEECNLLPPPPFPEPPQPQAECTLWDRVIAERRAQVLAAGGTPVDVTLRRDLFGGYLPLTKAQRIEMQILSRHPLLAERNAAASKVL